MPFQPKNGELVVKECLVDKTGRRAGSHDINVMPLVNVFQFPDWFHGASTLSAIR
jgi:hypothetical protein